MLPLFKMTKKIKKILFLVHTLYLEVTILNND